jgi:N-acetylmuramoyl-L-alanine amidase
MREIKYIFVHCTATPQDATVEAIQKYWKEVLGWRNPGYHILIDRYGNKTRLLEDSAISNGVGGDFNKYGLHVSWIGGKDGDNRTDAQKYELKQIISEWKAKYPKAEILGHRDAWFKYKYEKARKACPQFNAIIEYKDIK